MIPRAAHRAGDVRLRRRDPRRGEPLVPRARAGCRTPGARCSRKGRRTSGGPPTWRPCRARIAIVVLGVQPARRRAARSPLFRAAAGAADARRAARRRKSTTGGEGRTPRRPSAARNGHGAGGTPPAISLAAPRGSKGRPSMRTKLTSLLVLASALLPAALARAGQPEATVGATAAAPAATADPNLDRGFLLPTAMTQPKGTLTYNNYELLLHGVTYGITDNLQVSATVLSPISSRRCPSTGPPPSRRGYRDGATAPRAPGQPRATATVRRRQGTPISSPAGGGAARQPVPARRLLVAALGQRHLSAGPHRRRDRLVCSSTAPRWSTGWGPREAARRGDLGRGPRPGRGFDNAPGVLASYGVRFYPSTSRATSASSSRSPRATTTALTSCSASRS